jgi:hypothetical protein
VRKTTFIVCRLGAVSAVFFFCAGAFAQGCNLAVTQVDYEHECNGVDVPESYCAGAAGTRGNYCYMGYGVCSADGYQFTEANLGPDSSCEGGCCNGSAKKPRSHSPCMPPTQPRPPHTATIQTSTHHIVQNISKYSPINQHQICHFIVFIS